MAKKDLGNKRQLERPEIFGGGNHSMGRVVEKPKNFKETMWKLLLYIKRFRSRILIVFIFATLSTVFTIVSPYILADVTNYIVDGFNSKLKGGEGIDYKVIFKLLEILLVLYFFSSFFNYVQNWVMSAVAKEFSFTLRRDITSKINKLSLRYFDRNTRGDVLSRMTNDVHTISQTLDQSLSQIVTSVTTILGILFFMFLISWQMALVALVVLPLSFISVSFVVRKSQKYFVAQQRILGKLNGHVEEMFSGHTIMKAFNGEEKSLSIFKEVNNSLYESAWKSQFFSGLLMPIMKFVGNLGYVAVAVLGGIFALQGKIKVGDIQAFMQYMNLFNQPVAQAANIVNVLQSTAAAAERVFEFLHEEEEVLEKTEEIVPDKVKGQVEFDRVVFGYTKEKTVIKNFSLKVKSGQKIAIVGPTGAGKTTLVNLLMRFYDVDSGSIKIDGTDIKDFKRKDLRALFGMVLQDTWLFNGTIRENLAYGKIDATDGEVIEAARAAYADGFIRTLPDGYDMVLSEEVDNLSQGEKQLLTIARAMLANPPMLILDEATSSIDTRTEILIQEAMEKLTKGRTSFIIAHRLSTIKNADLILVMQDGDIVEQGKHEELLKKQGFYASLYNSQFAGGK